MIDILLVNTAYDPDLLGGAEHSVRELANDLHSAGLSVHVACLGMHSEVRVQDGIVVHRLSSHGFSSLISGNSRSLWRRRLWQAQELVRVREYAFLRGLLKRLQPRVVHFNNIVGFGWMTWMAARSHATVQTVRDYSLICGSGTGCHDGRVCLGSGLACRVLRSPFRFQLWKPSVIVGVSEYVADTLTKRSVTGKKLPNCSVLNRPPRVSLLGERQSSRIETFGFLGRIAKDKGVETILEAFSELISTPSNLREVGLVIGGEGEQTYVRDLENRFRSLIESGVVKFIGKTDPSEYLSMIDVALIPTQWPEPFGRVAAEAFSAGIPAIYSQVGGLPEVAARASVSSIGVENYNCVSSWVSALRFACAQTEFSRRDPDPILDIPNPCGEYLKIYERVGRQGDNVDASG